MAVPFAIIPAGELGKVDPQDWLDAQLLSLLNRLEETQALDMISAGARIGPTDSRGGNALHAAARFGACEALEMLLALPGIDLEARDSLGRTALLVAAGRGQLDFVKRLLPHCDADAARSNGGTPLMEAAYMGNAPMVELILSHCDPAATDSYGRTALTVAADRGSATCIRLLLPHVDPSAPDQSGMTPLMWAAKYGHEEAVALLAELCDPRAASNDGSSALGFTSAMEDDYPVFKRCAALLRERIASLDERDTLFAQTPTAFKPRIRQGI